MSEVWCVHGAVLGVAAVAAFTDVRTGHIPNWLTLPVLVLAPVAHYLVAGPMGAIFSAIGVVVAGLVPLVMFYRGKMGGGDVKVFAAIGAIVGPKLALEIQLLAFVVAAVVSLGLMAYRGTLLRTLGNVVVIVLGPLLPERRRQPMSEELTSTLRLGLSIFIGAVLGVFASHAGGLL